MAKMSASRVEQLAWKSSGRARLIYPPTEKLAVIEVDNFPQLGELAALRFLEWVQDNPGGVISLPTGKTPEHFIRRVGHYLKTWETPATQAELEKGGVDPARQPEMRGLRFVQIDEFYPINPTQINSFYHYIQKFYIKGFGLDPERALLIDAWNTGMLEGLTPNEVFPDGVVDLSLRTRYGKTRQERLCKSVIERVDQYCTEYEEGIRRLGGLGFFLGGIGPDGHIGFNVRGSDHFSTTRLTRTNYETQAAAATDLGGIEVARNRLVITIGLATITLNPAAVAIIIAAGEAKAGVVRDAIEEEPSNRYPATVLQKLKGARFYLTRGAAVRLRERACEDLERLDPVDPRTVEKVLIDLSLEKGCSLQSLSEDQIAADRSAARVAGTVKQEGGPLTETVRSSLIRKIERGLAAVEDQVIMHTAPHHDDIMLGYWAYMLHLVRTPRNQHYFNYMTSGFNAVTNLYARSQLDNLQRHIDQPHFRELMGQGYFDPQNELGRNRDIYQYLDGVAAHSRTMQNEGEARRTLRNLIFLFEETSLTQLQNRVAELILYFRTQYPGRKDLPYIQHFKGMIREWEADLLWGYLGFNADNVKHLRLGFYKGDIFTEEPDVERDVAPVTELLHAIRPTIVTVALDPEGSGPDTHYKVMQIVAEALRHYKEEVKRDDIEVWGYRNVWYRFHPSEADILVPVSLNSMAVLENAFEKCFGSQRDASFPSYELDGPFSRLARKIMVEQYQDLKICMSRSYFYENEHPRLRACRGIVYIKRMTLNEFFTRSVELRRRAEAL